MKNKKDLIAQISQNLAEPPPAAPGRARVVVAKTKNRAASGRAASRGDGVPHPPTAAEPVDAPRVTGSGKQAAFWLDDEDRAIFHETGMLLYSQGIKPSHNLVLRAAIRMIPRDHRLVEKVRELIEKDGRKVRHQKK
jgi:hypothetical protein